MARLVSVPALLLPLLLASASAATYSYNPLTHVSLPAKGMSEDKPLPSAGACAALCDSEPTCTGYTYGTVEEQANVCTYYTEDCRGPAAVSTPDNYHGHFISPNPDNYMAKNACPGTAADKCACPAPFRRYGTRCLALLEESFTNWLTAREKCVQLGAKLAVPRSPEEQDAASRAVAAGKPLMNAWLDLLGVSESQWIGLDECHVLHRYFWASGHTITMAHSAAHLTPPGMTNPPGWYSVADPSPPARPLCQLPACHRTDCPAN